MKRMLFVTGILCCMVIVGAFYTSNQKGKYLLAQNMEGVISRETSNKVQEECLKVAEIYKDIYLNTEKKPSDIIQTDTQISDEAVSKIVKSIGKEGFTVCDSAGNSSLENPAAFYDFWETVQKGEPAAFTVYRIRQNGGFYRYEFYTDGRDGTGYNLLLATVNLDSKGIPDIYDMKISPLSEWNFTEKENFIFRDAYTGWASGNGYRMIRIKPLDEKCLSYQKKYVEPIYYEGNNLLISNWSESDYSAMSFNDLFEYLYRMKEGERLEEDRFPIDPDNENRYIPADLFENIMLYYFPISQKELRKEALFDQKKNAYPWQEMRSNHNYVAMPLMEPDVTAVKENADGTVTLSVDVICLEKNNDRAFSHELTLRKGEDGSMQYVSNVIVPGEHNIIPNYIFRLQ